MADFRSRCAMAGTTPATVAQLAGRTARVGSDWSTGKTPVPAEIDDWLDRRLADPVPQLDQYRPVPPQLRR